MQCKHGHGIVFCRRDDRRRRQRLPHNNTMSLTAGTSSLPSSSSGIDQSAIDLAAAPSSSATIPVASGCPFRIGKGPKGRGLFATHALDPRTVIHVAPCIPVSGQEYQAHLQHTILSHYVFNDKRSSSASVSSSAPGSGSGNKLLALGYGSLFNHSNRRPNVDYRVDSERQIITYTTGHAVVAKDEELCISYGAHSNLWFDDTEEHENRALSAAAADHDQDDSDSDDPIGSFLGRIELEECER